MEAPIGTVIMWSGTVIPTGWHICDGSGGTRDLRGKLVLGAASGEVGATGGASSHKHTQPTSGSGESSHNHGTLTGNVGGGVGIMTEGAPAYYMCSGGHTHYYSITTGNGGPHTHPIDDTGYADNLPPNIKLYFIMRIS